MKKRINRLLGRLIAGQVEHRPGLEQLVSERVESRRLQIALTRLRRRGLQIEVVYDIGAHRGEWTKSVRPSLPGARFFLFEANAAHTGALRETGETYFIAVLSSEEKLVEFYGTGGPGDSYFKETSEHYVDVTPTSLVATTLDALVAAQELPYPDFIKADVQGAEIDVLQGGRNALGKASLVLLECPIVDYNEGAPSIDEYFRFMDARGFTPIEFVAPVWQKGRMVQVEVLFTKR